MVSQRSFAAALMLLSLTACSASLHGRVRVREVDSFHTEFGPIYHAAAGEARNRAACERASALEQLSVHVQAVASPAGIEVSVWADATSSLVHSTNALKNECTSGGDDVEERIVRVHTDYHRIADLLRRASAPQDDRRGRGDPHEDGEHGDPHEDGEHGDPHDDGGDHGHADDDHGQADEEHGHADEEHGHADEEHGQADEEHGHADEEHGHADEEHGHADEEHGHADEEHGRGDPHAPATQGDPHDAGVSGDPHPTPGARGASPH